MVDPTPLLPGLSPVQGRAVVARFDGGRLSSDGGLLMLREIEGRLGLADRLANCLRDPRAPERVWHRLGEIIRELEPGRAHRRPGRGRAAGERYPLYRDQSRGRTPQTALRDTLLRPRPGREPHQSLEEPSRCRPHLMPRGRGQPVPPLPSRRRLLAVVVAAPADAAALLLARHAVRHLAAPPDQDRRPRRRAEEADQDPPAVECPRSGHLPPRPRPPAAPAHLKHRAACPDRAFPDNLQRRPTPDTAKAELTATGTLAHRNLSVSTDLH